MNIKTTWEIITPEKAKEILKKNGKNRSISWSTVNAYARDMSKGYWTEGVGVGISIDENGILRDGQHRLEAIVKSGGKDIKLSDKEFVNLCKKDKHKKITSTVKDNGNFDITIEETEKLR